MAFPTSGLTNNLVHKEGNRAFVYDSALGVWDQVRESDENPNSTQQISLNSNVAGTLGQGVFPTGHITQIGTVAHTHTQVNCTSTSLADWTGMQCTITPRSATNKIIIMGSLSTLASQSSDSGNIVLFRNDGGGFDAILALGDYQYQGNSWSLCWIDSPGVTVQVTYKLQVRKDTSGTFHLNGNDSTGGNSITHEEGSNSYMYPMEVVA